MFHTELISFVARFVCFLQQGETLLSGLIWVSEKDTVAAVLLHSCFPLYTDTHTCTHTRTYTDTHTHTHMHTHTHTQLAACSIPDAAAPTVITSLVAWQRSASLPTYYNHSCASSSVLSLLPHTHSQERQQLAASHDAAAPVQLAGRTCSTRGGTPESCASTAAAPAAATAATATAAAAGWKYRSQQSRRCRGG